MYQTTKTTMYPKKESPFSAWLCASRALARLPMKCTTTARRRFALGILYNILVSNDPKSAAKKEEREREMEKSESRAQWVRVTLNWLEYMYG